MKKEELCEMDANQFSQIRHTLARTQSQFARVLCVSPKAVQSFEQGWRKIPTHIQRETLLLSALKHSDGQGPVSAPCWEIKNCPNEWRANCIVWELKVRNFCWYLNGTFCEGQSQENWGKKIKLCRQCKVFQLTSPVV